MNFIHTYTAREVATNASPITSSERRSTSPVAASIVYDIRDEFIKCINIQLITGTREKTNITQHAITRAYERKPVQLLIILFLMASHG